MKKLIALFLAAVMLFSLCACSDTPKTKDAAVTAANKVLDNYSHDKLSAQGVYSEETNNYLVLLQSPDTAFDATAAFIWNEDDVKAVAGGLHDELVGLLDDFGVSVTVYVAASGGTLLFAYANGTIRAFYPQCDYITKPSGLVQYAYDPENQMYIYDLTEDKAESYELFVGYASSIQSSHVTLQEEQTDLIYIFVDGELVGGMGFINAKDDGKYQMAVLFIEQP